MTLSEFVKTTFKSDKYGFCMRPTIICNDGFTMSVQGSRTHYCTPRVTQDSYYRMEIGFPSDQEDLIMEYAESPDRPTDTVYGYVPCEVIESVIIKHGGINQEKTFSNKNYQQL
jgi:hypothetical protein